MGMGAIGDRNHSGTGLSVIFSQFVSIAFPVSNRYGEGEGYARNARLFGMARYTSFGRISVESWLLQAWS